MSFWRQINTAALAQGDYLPSCSVPVIGEGFAEPVEQQRPERVRVDVANLIVVTQSCDLENDKAPWVACCPVHTLAEFEGKNPGAAKRWEMVRQGRVEGLHLLGSFTAPDDNTQALVVNFRQIFSLPVGYLRKRAADLGDRQRLESPFLEHFSQAFARFFMRVGLPSAIPAYKK